MSFANLNLSAEVFQAISELGYENPTPVQEQTIPFILNSHSDLIALAQTGTGKTAAFSLPIIEQIDPEAQDIQALILSPTRELCLQIHNDIQAFTKFLPDLKNVPVYGGSSIETQIRALKRGAQIVVGTPGRTLDLIRRKKLKVDNIRWMVLDEADEMLTMGFQEDLNAILANTPDTKQTFLFSATMPQGIRQIADQYMHEVKEISIGKRNTGVSNVDHSYVMVHAKDRYEALKRLVDYAPDIYGIVFCRTREETKTVASKLADDHYNSDALHGDMTQGQRDLAMQKFRNKKIQLLVATDVAARGLDVENLTHIINYNLPDDTEVYIHRTGRTGRAGRSGKALSIIHLREKHRMRQLEKKIGRPIEKIDVPDGKAICSNQLYHLIDKVEKVNVNEAEIAPFVNDINKKLEWIDREDLIKRFLSVEFNRFLSYYENTKDINVADRGKNERKTRDKSPRPERGSSAGAFTRYYINLGQNQGITPRHLIQLVNSNLKKDSFAIGKIEVMKKFSFFEIESHMSEKIEATLNGVMYKEKIINLEKTKKAKTETPLRDRKKRKRY
jgi:ATP-dependent RNA helicase DeaD